MSFKNFEPKGSLGSEIVEVATYSDLPVVGKDKVLYITLDDNKTYRWGGSVYVQVGGSLALGETSSTAYRGDRGKIAYDHTSNTSNPHNTTTSQIGAENVANKISSFQVTPDDIKYPTEKLVKDNLDLKVDKITGKGLSTNDFTDTLKTTYDGYSSSKENVSNKVSAFQTTPDDIHYASEKLVKDSLDTKAEDNNVVKLTGNQSIDGIKTFSSFPITPSSAPTTDYQTANKKYVDDQLSGENLWDRSGTEVYPHNIYDNINLKGGGLKDINVTTPIKVGDYSNTALNTTNKTIIGGINEINSNLTNNYLTTTQIDAIFDDYEALFVNNTTGSDTTGTGSKRKPYKTIQKVLDTYASTRVIYVKSSTTQDITFNANNQSFKIIFDPKTQHTGTINLVDGNTSIYFSSENGSATLSGVVNDASKGNIYWNVIKSGTYNKTGGSGAQVPLGYVEFGVSGNLDSLILNITGNTTIRTFGTGAMGLLSQSNGIYIAQHNGSIICPTLTGGANPLLGMPICLLQGNIQLIKSGANSLRCSATYGVVYLAGISTLQTDMATYGKVDFIGSGANVFCYVWSHSQLASSGDVFPTTGALMPNSANYLLASRVGSNYTGLVSGSVKSHLDGIDTKLGYLRDSEYWVSDASGSDTTGNGSRTNPYKTAQKVIDLYGANANHKVIYFDHYINENLVFASKQNITIIGVGITDSQQSNITGNHTISGTSTRIRFKDTIMTTGTGVDDYIIKYNGSAGRHYNENTSFVTGASKLCIQFIGANARWHEFYNCYVGGIVDCNSSTTSMSVKFTRQLAGEFKLNMNTFCTTNIYECQRYDQINHTSGKLYINGLYESYRTSDNIGIVSTATSASGSYFELQNVKMRNNANTWMKINKTGDCDFMLNGVSRDISIDVLTGTQVYGFQDLDIKNTSNVSGNSIKDALNTLNATGSGNVNSNETESIDGEITLFNGITGKLIKRGNFTGMLKANSGVVSSATAGTDYIAGNDARVGTKEIDETNIGNDKIQVYNSTSGKLEYQSKPTGSTNLSITNKTSTSLDIASDTGTDATIPEASITEAGLLNSSDKIQLANLTTNFSNKVEKNASITGATKTKITYDEKGLVTNGSDATTSDIADSTDKRYVTDTEKIRISEINKHQQSSNAPTIYNDNTQGYTIGSQWLKTDTNILYECKDATTDNAVWVTIGGGGGTTTFANLTDVSILTPLTKQIPIYNQTSSKWENGYQTFDNLNDVDFTGKINNSLVKYNSNTSKYEITNSPIVNSLSITNSPVNSTDAVRKSELDAVTIGIKFKENCRVASTTTLTPTSVKNGDSMDGVTLATNDRFLYKNGTTLNGIYVVGASNSIRSLDCDTWEEIVGMNVLITAGSTNINTMWRSNIASGGTLGTDSIPMALIPNTISDGSVTNNKIANNAGIDATKIADGSISNTEYQYLNGLTGNIQTQLDGKSGGSEGVLYITTTGGTTYLTASDNKKIVLNGTASHNINMEDATYLGINDTFKIYNKSTSAIPVVIRNNDTITLVSIRSGQSCEIMLTDNSSSGGNWTILNMSDFIGSYIDSPIQPTSNYIEANGSTISRTGYAALFNLYNSLTPALPFGSGNGSTTFTLPDYLGRASGYAGAGTGLTTRTLGTLTGTETITLTSTNLPNHRHDVTTGSAQVNTGSTFYVRTTGTTGSSFYTGYVGGGGSHDNMSPIAFGSKRWIRIM